jgi:hypothetical protein
MLLGHCNKCCLSIATDVISADPKVALKLRVNMCKRIGS